MTLEEFEKQATQLIEETKDHHDLCSCVKCVALDALCSDIIEETSNKDMTDD